MIGYGMRENNSSENLNSIIVYNKKYRYYSNKIKF